MVASLGPGRDLKSLATGSALGSYAAWVRSAIAAVADSHGSALSLFESSVPEPVDLLRTILTDAFGHGLTTRYTSAFASGNPFVVDQLKQRYAVGADSILCTTGATGALSLLYRAFLGADERVLIENPGFDLFAGFAEALHVGVDRFERDPHDFSLDPAKVAAAMHPRTRLVVVSNLHNPSGALIGDDVLAEVARIAARNGAQLVLDEVYRDHAGLARPMPVSLLGENVISISSLTKVYGLSTLRCGWLVADPAIVARVRALHDEFEFGVSKLAHAIAALVLEHPAPFDRFFADCLTAARPVVERHYREWLAEGLVEGPLPQFGCIWFPRLPGIRDTMEFATSAAERDGVFVPPGDFFGAPGHVRIGFGQEPARLEAALARLGVALRRQRHPRR
jgi:aspartate/methionine/tyrosine aminotransferase